MKSKMVTVDLLSIFPKFPETDEFHLELGQFITAYSIVEQSLVVVLKNYANLSIPVSKALFSNARPDTTMTAIRRVIEVRKLRGSKIVELKSILDHLGTITKVRNDLVHLGSHPVSGRGDDKRRIVTNKLLAHSHRVKRRFPLSAAVLKAINVDLFEISLRLTFHMHPRPLKMTWDWFERTIISRFRNQYPASRLPAWRYKSPSPKARRHKSHDPHQAHKVPPQSSLG